MFAEARKSGLDLQQLGQELKSRKMALEGQPDRRSALMARKYSKTSGMKVERAMHEMKQGTLRSGRSGTKVKSRKQAIAIGLSEARRSGAKVPRKSAGSKSSRSRRS
jgi:hypothetical protein